MPSATVTAKGQVTIPADVRLAHGIEPGHKLVFFTRLDGSLGVRVSKPRVGAGYGILAHLAPNLSLQEMRAAVGDAAAEDAQGSSDAAVEAERAGAAPADGTVVPGSAA